ncbi:MAG: hypothetical protein H6R15_296 [Proteobacteria bacterium]|nr:hypothetical protein [Pseudomonadota bacterium]
MAIAITPLQANPLSSLANITPLAFQFLTAGTSATGSTLFDSASSIVQVSALGQVLASSSQLATSLQALRSSPTNATPATVETAAQNFVSAFNRVGTSIDSVQPFLGTLNNGPLVARFSQTLNAAATSTTGSGDTNLSALQSLGISLQTPLSPTTGARLATLSIDQSRLTNAIAADPGGTLSQLAQATQPLALQVAAFTAQATNSTELPSDLNLLGAGIATNLLQNLSADTVLNNVPLSDLDLAALGLDANTLQLTGRALPASLSATLQAASEPTLATTVATAQLSATDTLLGTTAPTPLAATTQDTTSRQTAAPVVPPPAFGTASGTAPTAATTPALGATANADLLAAQQANTAATQALQQLVENPNFRALSNNLFNPVYSALIAATHQNDFTSPLPATRPDAIPIDTPAPVLPADVVRGIESYNQAARDFARPQARVNS